MVTMFAHHAVKDFEAWKRGAEEAMNDSDRNAAAGIGESRMYRTIDGNGVIVTHEFADLEAARKYKEMMESSEGQAFLEGVGGLPPVTIWIAEGL